MKIPEIADNAGDILKELRENRGISQVVLADRMGLNSSQHIWNIEHKRNNLTLSMIDPAATALGVNPDVFLRQKVK